MAQVDHNLPKAIGWIFFSKTEIMRQPYDLLPFSFQKKVTLTERLCGCHKNFEGDNYIHVHLL